jgi:hypothetical protein
MSGCALRRWGPGTTKERAPNTESARQLESSLSALIAARAALDAPAPAPTTTPSHIAVPQIYITESSIIDTRTPQMPDKNDMYRLDKLRNTGDGSKPQVQARTQLTSSMNWGAF